MATSSGITASSLCARLVDGPEQVLTPVHRSEQAWQLADSDGRVVLCLTSPAAIRLPHAVVTPTLPSGSYPIVVGRGAVAWDGRRHRISRWWQPARPQQPVLRGRVDESAAREFATHWRSRLGQGQGLTPYGDDVICGAVVLLRAAEHPIADVVATDLLTVDLEKRTTATSAALLRLAADGWCIDQLAGHLAELASGKPEPATTRELLSVGHSSGTGLAEGVRLLLGERSEGVAA